MASYITDSYMAGITISRHVDELVQLTTEQKHGMARQPTVRRHVYESKHGNRKFIGWMDH